MNKIMKMEREIFHGGIPSSEHSRIIHRVCLADFNTNYPSTDRIDRIAREINEYLTCKNKYAKEAKQTTEKE